MSRGMVETDVIAISGGFDPLHGGHIDYIDEASTHGKVMVFLNSDEWLMRKKGFVFMKWEERAKILRKIDDVMEVVKAEDDDDTVIKSLERYRPDCFGKGGDRNYQNTPEVGICKLFGIKLLFGLGGNKTQSSSKLVEDAKKS